MFILKICRLRPCSPQNLFPISRWTLSNSSDNWQTFSEYRETKMPPQGHFMNGFQIRNLK